MALIATKNLKKIYDSGEEKTIAANDISIEIEAGEFVAIVGPSGSGKSTLMHILGCLDRPTHGHYFFEGKDLVSYTDDELAVIRNRKIGFVFQSFNLLPRLSVLENVKLPLLYSGIPEAERIRKAEKVIDLVGLRDRINYPAVNLSGGQKQRVAIARALVNEPKIIFADEPTGNLDSKSGEAVLDFFRELNRQGHTLVVVTHDRYVASAARRAILIKDGKVEKDGSVAEVMRGRE